MTGPATLVSPANRLGIYGGTFNPIHNGHLAVAKAALTALDLNSIIFIPAGNPPLKDHTNLLDATIRLNMVTMAVAKNPHYSVCDYEVRRPQKSFTIDTINYLLSTQPSDTELYFIVGDDCIASLHRWKDIEQLSQLVTFACVNRHGSVAKISSQAIHYVAMPVIDISSTQIRKRCQNKQIIHDITPTPVADFITNNNLYAATATMRSH